MGRRLAPGVIPNAAGVSLKPQHFEEIMATKPGVAWFEIHPENYLMDGGKMLMFLTKIRENYPLSFHSVGMSLGSVGGVTNKKKHLLKLKNLIDRFEPGLVSDHLSWSSWQQISFNDLLPMPYNTESLTVMCENIDRAQTILGRQIAIENPSSYININNSDAMPVEWSEADFLVRLARQSGAKILLDINNIYVSAINHGWDAKQYIKKIPANLVTELHLAGHTRKHFAEGDILIDDHGSAVCDDVWQLYTFALDYFGVRPSLIEWDTNVPDLSVLTNEAEKANDLLLSVMGVRVNKQLNKQAQ